MKVLIVNTFYYPNMAGGAEQSVKLLAENLVKRNHEVAIYCADGKDGVCEDTEVNGVKVYRRTTNKFNLYRYSYEKSKVGKIEKIIQTLYCYYNKKCMDDFKKILEEFKPDVIHSNTTYGISKFVWKVAYKKNIPVVQTVRDIGFISAVNPGKKVPSIINFAHIMYNRFVCKYVSAVTAPSNYTLDSTLKKINFKNALVKKCVFNSVEVDLKNIKKILEEKKKNKSKIINFMYAGRLIYYKGIEHMLNAFELLDNKNIRLHICGDGPMKEYVEKAAKNDSRIVYHGKLNNEELAKQYENSDVLLVPSYWPEPFGRVLIEGNIYGLPCIVGNCGGMPEIVDNTKGGIIYEAGSAKELSLAMEKFIDRSYIVSFYDNIEKNINIYDIKYQIDEFDKIYNELLRRKI